ncbi:hypothetical protein JQX13_04235 [Archangium violaceum]|uniref:hypothetical protein n=1 Tax=Archangium violaceum TaxID=83451 RepID=UPI00193B6D71|nr:hypothetical protein [Archangium violaceum]QRK09364.1 hypothetical protein JQX13_04235 [Archangium violaceum]
MSIRDDKKDLDAAGGPVPADRYRGQAERVADAEDHDAKKADKKLTDEPGPDFRVASGGESEAEHAFTTDSPRWGEEGTSREERGYPREGEEERRVGEAPPERDINPRE